GGPTFTHALLVGSLAIDAGGDLTTLSAAVDNLATTINVTDASAFPVGIGFVIQIDSEQMIVTDKTNNALTVTRAANGTISAAHNTGAGMNPLYEQRGLGFPRIINSRLDIGSFEAQPPFPTPTPTPIPTPTPTPTATPTPPSC